MNKYRIILLLCAIALLQACVAVQTFPVAARSGDTVSLAVGSPDGMTKSNTTATFVSDVDSSSTNLPIRAIIRLRPDQTSTAALYDSFVNAEDGYTGHSQWITVVVIDLPTLPVGTGHIDIQSAASYGTLPHGINDIPISMEILSGTGTPDDFTYNTGFGGTSSGNLTSLEPVLYQVVFKSTTATEDYGFAAAEVTVNVPMSTVPKTLRVVSDDFYTKNPKKQLQMSWKISGNDITVFFVSPKGGIFPKQLRFNVVSASDVFTSSPGPSITSVKLYDIDGNPKSLFTNATNESIFTIGIQ